MMAAARDEDNCVICGNRLASRNVGRPSRYCSPACRQRAYRRRRANPADAMPRASHQSSLGPIATPPAISSAERPVPHLTEPQLLAWRGMLEVQSRLLPLLDADLQQQAGLTINEFDLLYQLWIAPEQRQRMNHLAKALLVTPSGVTRMVSRLERRGLVERVNVQGRQAVDAALTTAGQRKLQAAMDIHFLGVRRLFIDNCSDSDVTRLVALWRRLRSVLAPLPGY